MSQSLWVEQWYTTLLSDFDAQTPLKHPLTKPFVILNHLRFFLIQMTIRCLEKLVYCDVYIL